MPAIAAGGFCASRSANLRVSAFSSAAGPTRATVALCYRPGALEVRVRNEGRGSAHGVAAGRGIVGMRHRAAQLGGEMAAEPRPEGGFQVTATLPVDGEGP